MAENHGNDLRAALEDAISKHEEPDAPEAEAPASAEALPENTGVPAPEESAVPGEAAPAPEPESASAGAPIGEPGVSGEPVAPETPSEAPEPAAKPPGGWTPAEREHWAAMPPEAQAAVMRREKEIATGMEEAAQARRFHQHFQSELGGFESLAAAEGAQDMVQASKALFQTAAVLRQGTPQQKASRVWQLMNHYGVDVETLAAVIEGSPEAPGAPQGPGAPPQGDPALDARLRPLEDFVQAIGARMQAADHTREQSVASEMETFLSTHEYANDVRLEMADLLDMAARRGREMSLQDAYDIATAAHPEIGPILRQREAATGASTTRMADKAAASSSLASQPAATPAPVNGSGAPASTSLRDDLLAAVQFAEEQAGGRI